MSPTRRLRRGWRSCPGVVKLVGFLIVHGKVAQRGADEGHNEGASEVDVATAGSNDDQAYDGAAAKGGGGRG